MTPRMQNPAFALPNVGSALISLGKALATARQGNIPPKLAFLTHLRASQINGCGYCVSFHSHDARKGGDTEERLYAVSAWRHSNLFSPTECIALELTEAMTMPASDELVSDALVSDALVSDELWERVVANFSEEDVALLILEIATTNLWNRLNNATRQQFTGTSEVAD